MDKVSAFKKAKDWAENPCFDPSTREEVAQLITSSNTREILERFSCELAFGTGGMRGLVGAGTARVNRYTMKKATTALCLYMKEVYGNKSSLKVAISFDSRNTSKEFSEVVSSVLAYHGIHTYLTRELRPTPLLSFMVRHFQCHAGICLTASHNPPSYNGYKVYWADGGQIVDPHDEGIISHYNRLDDYAHLNSLEFKEACEKGFVTYCDEEADLAYLKVQREITYREPKKRDQRIVYTPLHGAGGTILPRFMKERGYENFFLVPEQKDPDGLFPTVTSPNPEDKEALILAKAYADKKGAKLVLATDPDADRLGVSLKNNGTWVDLSGNELASLLTSYIFSSLAKNHFSFKDSYIVKTNVTTDLLKKIAHKYNCDCYETLTGFKWIASIIAKKEKEGKTFLCGGEESLGFLAKDFVRDKDAISSAALFCEFYSNCEEEGQSVFDVLDTIYEEFGIHSESLKTLSLPGLDGLEKINKIMTSFREFEKKEFFGLQVLEFLDYKKRTKRSSNKSYKEEPFTLFPESDVLSFSVEKNLKVVIRPSGTEAKIKFYFSLAEDAQTFASIPLRERKERSLNTLKSFEENFLSHLSF